MANLGCLTTLAPIFTSFSPAASSTSSAHLLRQGQRSYEIAEIVGQSMKLEPGERHERVDNVPSFCHRMSNRATTRWLRHGLAARERME